MEYQVSPRSDLERWLKNSSCFGPLAQSNPPILMSPANHVLLNGALSMGVSLFHLLSRPDQYSLFFCMPITIHRLFFNHAAAGIS